jgi:hypothetical protein
MALAATISWLSEPSRRGLYIHDNGITVVDEVVGLVAEATGSILYRPGGLRVCQEDGLGRLVLQAFVRLVGFNLELIEVGLHGARHGPRACPGIRDLVRRSSPVPAGVGLDGAAVDQGTFASDETRLHAPAHHHLEHCAQHVAIGGTPMPVSGEARPVRHLALRPQATEPPVSQVEVDLLAKPRLQAEAVKIPHQQHAIISSGPMEGRPMVP